MTPQVSQNQTSQYFIMLTFIVIVVIIIMSHDTFTTIMIIGLMVGFIYINNNPHLCDISNFKLQNPLMNSYPFMNSYPAYQNQLGNSMPISQDQIYSSSQYPIDGDERLSYQSLSRNDPKRPIMGVTRRRRDMDKYLREEVDEEENRRWWGQDEY
jgi:hypothetical protein